MSEQGSRVVHPPLSDGRELIDRVEDLEDLGELEDFEESAQLGDTGAYRRTSLPPPIPAHARQQQPAGALLPQPRAQVDAGQLPPALGVRASWPPSSSGMFRIDRASTPAPPVSSVSSPGLASAPPPAAGASLPPPAPASRTSTPPPIAPRASAPAPPTLASEPAELKRALSALSQELREHTGQIHRLRLMIRLREDRIRDLEAELRDQRQRSAATEQELARIGAQHGADDLKRISGIGPAFERALHAIGVTSFRQIAEWTPVELERIARDIRTTPRRILRDRWVEHARELAQ